MNKRCDDRRGWCAMRGLAMVGALAVILALAGCGPGSRSSTPARQPVRYTVRQPVRYTVRQPVRYTVRQPARHAAHGQTHSPLAAAYPGYEVVAYYFSGWSHGQSSNISRLLTGRMHASEPLIGWYDDSQAQVDQAIAEAADAGIDFFAFGWYRLARSR